MDFVKKYGLKLLVSLIFVAIGGMKLTQNPQIIESLVGLGYPAYLGYILGAAYVLAPSEGLCVGLPLV